MKIERNDLEGIPLDFKKFGDSLSLANQMSSLAIINLDHSPHQIRSEDQMGE